MPLVKPTHMPVNGSQIQSAADYASPLHIVRKETALRCIGAVRSMLLMFFFAYVLLSLAGCDDVAAAQATALAVEDVAAHGRLFDADRIEK